MSVEFTDEQLEVINARDCNVLVSAAAGSGKTAVLVERIIRKIIVDGQSIDRMLVVTFTEAAALEMKERISQAIEKCLEADPQNTHLLAQSTLLYKAQISTIHSFCLNIIRNNFNEIELDPDFKIADETYLTLLSNDCIDEMMEDYYASNDTDFLACVNYFSNSVKDDLFKETVLKLSELAEGYPWPCEWLDECAKSYAITDKSAFDDSQPVNYLLTYVQSRVKDAIGMAEAALKMCDLPNGPSQYRENIAADIEIIEHLNKCTNYDHIHEYIGSIEFSRLSNKKNPDCDEEIKSCVKNLRDTYKSMLKSDSAGSVKNLFGTSKEQQIEYLTIMRPYVNKLIEVTKEYLRRFELKKRSLGIVSFSDMEHYAIRILYTTGENNEHELSKTAYEYKAAFDEVLMDEYQDCNRVQELLIDAISGESEGKYNKFLVGDVKQSIYKFRLSSPELFTQKYKSYQICDHVGQDKNTHRRIDLHKNFRSRESVINTVNDLFSQIMHESLGGVEYDEDAYLVKGSDFPCYEGGNTKDENEHATDTQILLMANDSDSDLKREIQEAMMVATKIKELIMSYRVTDKETHVLRKCRYKDIVILVRSSTDVTEGLRYVFNQEGIPYYTPIKTGFYESIEIQEILQLLKVIDNPLQDIALYGTLKSYFGGFTDEEIARLKCEEGLLYYDLMEKKDSDPKVERFIDMLNRYRRLSRHTPIHELISMLIYETGYLEYVLSQTGGVQKKANVEMLISKAAMYENTSFRGLFHFLRYVSRIKKASVNEGEADTLSENADVVRIMTIHKSKGLEFPICFLCGIHKEFNRMDSRGNLIIDMDFGLGTSCIDLERRIKVNPLIKNAISLKINQDMIGEELRVLYVALTRAKEKIILTGIVKNDEKHPFDEKIANYIAAHVNSKAVSYSEIADAKSYLDFVMPIMDKASIVTLDDVYVHRIKDSARMIEKRGFLEKEGLQTEKYRNEYEALKEKSASKYAYPLLNKLVLKTSVSELKKAYLDTEFAKEMFTQETDVEENAIKTLDKDIQSHDKISATDRGSAYHKVMELLDFNNKDVKSQINIFKNNGLLSNEWADAVSVDKIEKFMENDLAQRMGKALRHGTLKREQPFVLGMDSKDVNKDYPAGETILLQGIIDAYFIEDGKIVLLDYKTDVIKSGEELMNRYKIQLEYYAEALSRILGMEVKESILYSFCLGECVYKA